MAKKDFKEYKKFLSSLAYPCELDTTTLLGQYKLTQAFLKWKIDNDIFKQEFLLGVIINDLTYLKQLKSQMEFCDELNGSFNEFEEEK